MLIRRCRKGEKECCANCCYLGIERDRRGISFAVCKKSRERITFAYSQVCSLWEKFL